MRISYDGSYLTVTNATTTYTLNRNARGFTVAVGNQAGLVNQAQNAIAIGNQAGQTNQSANSIVLNASGTVLNATAPGLYVSPIATTTSSTATSFTLLGYGTDNQVVQTGMNVLSGNGYTGIGIIPQYPFQVVSGGVGYLSSSTPSTIVGSFLRNIGYVTTDRADIEVGSSHTGVGNFGCVYKYRMGVSYFGSTSGGSFQLSSVAANASSYTGADTVTPIMTVSSAGNVGIGTTTPGYSLHVIGSVNLTGSILYNGVAITTGTGSIWTAGSGGVAYYNGGNVGIGTATPAAKLSVIPVDGTTNYGLLSFMNTSGYGIYVNTTSVNSRGNTLDWYTYDYNFGAITARPILTMRPEGLVGIGTTLPQSNQLMIFGGNAVSGISLGDYNTTGAGVKYIGITAVNSGTNLSTNSGFSGITFGGPNDGGGTSGYLAFHSHGFGATSGERMRIDKSGNVGIGTATPNYAQTISASGFILLELQRTSASTNYGSGIVHSLVSNGFRGEYVRTGGASNGTTATTSQTQANGVYFIDLANAGVFKSDANALYSAFYMTNTSASFNGPNVGIGTTAPGYLLDVNGTARITGSLSFSSTGTQTLSSGTCGSIGGFVPFVHCSSDLLIGWSTAPSGNQYNDVGTNAYGGISLRGSGNASSVMCATTYVPFVATKYGTSPSQMMVFAYSAAIGTGPSTIGSITHTTTSVAYNTTSDARLKENIEDVSNIRDMIDLLRPRTFTFIGDEKKDQHIGFIAQEIRDYYPQYVSGTETEKEFLGMDYGKISPFAIAACKDLYLKNDALTAQVTTQATTIIELEGQVARLLASQASLLAWAQSQGFSG